MRPDSWEPGQGSVTSARGSNICPRQVPAGKEMRLVGRGTSESGKSRAALHPEAALQLTVMLFVFSMFS